MTTPDCVDCNCPRIECFKEDIDGKIKVAVLEVENTLQNKVASRRGVVWSYIIGSIGILLAIVNSIILFFK